MCLQYSGSRPDASSLSVGHGTNKVRYNIIVID